ncbi:putative membrane protein [Bacteroides fragilis str. 3976T8]|uniref:Putative membrane protein n=2 Tax=Bacteroides fragilis TaxID=817 RepID=A0A016AQM2_BACFG|nr:putative membrane protein [Bacteroides fragilis str. 3976T8]
MEAVRIPAHEIGNDCFTCQYLHVMKTKECIRRIKAGGWLRTIASGVIAFIVFSYVYSRGISPVWAAVAIVCFSGFFRFLYRIACLLVAAAILFCILSFLVS